MLKSWQMIYLLIALLVACAPAAPATDTLAGNTAATEQHDDHDEETHDDEHDEDEHDENEQREAGAHEHGVAMMTVAWSGSEMLIDLETPAFNVVGFEHAPSTDEQQALFDESVAALETGNLLQISSAADCAITSATAETELAEEGAAEEENTHSDIDVSYMVECLYPDNIAELNMSDLFTQFPNFEELQVQWVSDTDQSAKRVTPDDPIIELQ